MLTGYVTGYNWQLDYNLLVTGYPEPSSEKKAIGKSMSNVYPVEKKCDLREHATGTCLL